VGWDGAIFVEMICPTGEAKYFCKRDSTSKSPDSLSGKSAGQAIRPARGNLKIFFSICRPVQETAIFRLIPPVAERRFSCSLTWLPITPHPEFHGRAVPVLDDQAK
jgi:hypothetical protein